jgi:hypothetical protein
VRKTLSCLAVTAIGAALTAGPASAAPATDWTSGLTFYQATTATPVANFAHPDGVCTPFPATATLLIGWSDVEQVVAYRGADCTGVAVGLGTLRGFRAGEYRSFSAF